MGAAAVAAAAFDLPAAPSAALLGAAWVGSMLPDVDVAGSRVHRRSLIERRVFVVRLAGALARVPLRLLIALPHRGITHSVVACAAAGVLTRLLVAPLAPGAATAAGAGMAVGYGIHVAADACTPAGVPAWSPFSARRRWLLPRRVRIRTGSLGEYALTALLVGLVVAATAGLTG